MSYTGVLKRTFTLAILTMVIGFSACMVFLPGAHAEASLNTPSDGSGITSLPGDEVLGDSSIQMANGTGQECYYNCMKKHGNSYCKSKCGWSPR